MGTLHYGEATFEVDDDALHHLTAILVARLRRRESFLALVRSEDGYERLWIHPMAHVRIAAAATDRPLDPARLAHMMRAASTPAGVDLLASWDAPTRTVRR